jgi:hypothetical protein
MKNFRTKTIRCEWQVVIQQVDQYGCNYPNSAVVLDRWPTAEEAYADLPNHGREHEFVKGRWIPNDAISAYEWLEVQYREVEVK